MHCYAYSAKMRMVHSVYVYLSHTLINEEGNQLSQALGKSITFPIKMMSVDNFKLWRISWDFGT